MNNKKLPSLGCAQIIMTGTASRFRSPFFLIVKSFAWRLLVYESVTGKLDCNLKPTAVRKKKMLHLRENRINYGRTR